MPNLNIQLPDVLIKQLKAIAKQKGRLYSSLIEEVLTDYVANKQQNKA